MFIFISEREEVFIFIGEGGSVHFYRRGENSFL